MGDQILEVSGVSITSSEFNVFANIYKNATSPVEFVVQSLQTAKVCYIVQGSIYGRRDHCQSEYDFKHSEPEICNFYVQKIKIIMVFIINYNVPSIWSWKPKKMTGKRVFSTENFDRNIHIEKGFLFTQ